jgi:hypothetical protein
MFARSNIAVRYVEKVQIQIRVIVSLEKGVLWRWKRKNALNVELLNLQKGQIIYPSSQVKCLGLVQIKCGEVDSIRIENTAIFRK